MPSIEGKYSSMKEGSFLPIIPFGIIFIVIVGALTYTKYQQIIAQRAKRFLNLPTHNISASNLPLTQYVNPFIGTAPGGSHSGFEGNSGNVFPGVAIPMGMFQWSPDTNSNPPGGYYYPDNQIKGFSLTHFSGRGCQYLQDIPFTPYVGNIITSPASNSKLYWSRFSHQGEEARPGYYKVYLQDQKVWTELTSAAHAGIGKFTYPSSNQSSMLINSGGSINGNSDAGISIDPNNQKVSGFSSSTVGCGSNSYTIYFVAKFDQLFTSYGTWNGDSVEKGSMSTKGSNTGAFIVFDTTKNTTVQALVGISFVSIANAEENANAENTNWDFSKMQQNAENAWNNRLNSIQVQGGTRDEKTIFYTALYHTFFHPNIFEDVNGQYIGFDNKIHTVQLGRHQYENIPGWDQYRSLTALRAVLAPNETSDVLQSLVNDANQGDGHLPRWEQENTDSKGMIGDSADAEIATGYAFGATRFDASSALNAMLNGQGNLRDGLGEYLNKHYVSANTPGSAAVTLEYSIDDFSIAQFAHKLGYSCLSPIYTTYINRAKSWENLFNPSTRYIELRNADGSWQKSNPTSQNGFVEGNSIQYSWMIPFDLQNLFYRMGGNSIAVRRLDNFFTNLNEGPDSQYAFMGNEPSLEVPWEYNFAGAPYRTQEVVRRVQMNLFHNAPPGLPGNDDAGSLSSWYVFSAIGLYPEVPGVGGFFVGSPLFSSVTIRLPENNAIQISSPGAADNAPYIQTLTINGQETSSPWIPWEAVQSGANMDFFLASRPSGWGSSVADTPSFMTCSN